MSKARNLSNTIRVDDAVTLPSGDTASRPAGAVAGSQRFNTETGSIEFYDGTGWISTNLIPTVDSVTGTIYAGAASTLTIGVSNATDTITVRFSEGGSTIADVADVAVSAGSASVAVPSAVYGQTAGDTIAVSVINLDGTPSSNAINKTVQALPTGGTITTSGSYRIHTFTSSSSFVVPSGTTLTDVEYLVIAGGGSGGTYGGGGGAGGYRSSVVGQPSGGGASAESRLTLSANTYTVTVGAGGASVSGITQGISGSNSVFGSITSTGGGGGAQGGTTSALSGGSGGGGAYEFKTGASGTSGQGYAGGNGASPGSFTYTAGGGGGAGAVGGNGSTSVGGDSGPGGAGVSSSITGSAITRAGGGGGGSPTGSPYDSGQDGGAGGSGGGGAGGTGGNGTSGAVNTGSGGGGGGYNGSSGVYGASGAGGSGIVIVRYQL